MPEPVRQAFELYAQLGPERTLAKLCKAYAERGESLTLVTAKRWSSKYGWRGLIKQQAQTLARAFSKRLGQEQIAQQVDDLTVVRQLIGRFKQRVMLDPADPTLTADERRLAFAPTLKDYALLMQLEKQLAADEEGKSAPALQEIHLDPREVARLSRERAKQKYPHLLFQEDLNACTESAAEESSDSHTLPD